MTIKLSKKRPEKRLLLAQKESAGRGAQGRITIRHRGGGVKKLYRMIDFGQKRRGAPAVVVSLEYDPNRSAFISLIQYPQDGRKAYVLAAEGQKEGDQVICDEIAEIKIGNRMTLKNIPVGQQVFNVELEPGRGGKLIRGAGASAKVLAQEDCFTQLELPSKEIRKIFNTCYATIGQVSHADHRFEDFGNAGSKRRKGWRPTVRGTAMNPPDHPHGGGEGKTPIGLKYPKTPWGKSAHGVKTRKKKWTEKYIIQRRK
ncbi:MAG: 50S ribosomal protein L2 [bacterium]